MNKKLYLMLIPAVVIVAAAIIYLDNFSGDTVSQEKASETTQTVEQTESLNNDENVVTETPKTTESVPESSSSNENVQPEEDKSVLAVSPTRCRGCGRCVAIDPAHFEMSGRTATVISQENLNSSALDRAISSCPADAITLS